MLSPLLTIPLSALVTTVILHHFACRCFPKFHLLDFPSRYGLSRSPLPYPTGILSIIVFLGFYVTFEQLTHQALGLISSIVILTFYSFIDDRRPLPWWMRLTVQLIAAFLIFATGSRIYTITNPLEILPAFGPFLSLDSLDILTPGFGPLPVLSGIFTLVWLGLTMNALNWFDGIPGQMHLLSGIGFLIIGLLSLSSRVEQPELALLSFILAGIACGSLLFDFPPPRVVPGDTGAIFFGLMLGVLTIYSGGKVATAFLVLGVPLIDSFIVIIRRLLKCSSLAKGNTTNEHLHHRLRTKGWSDRKIIALTAVLGTGFGSFALFASTFEKFIAALVLFAVMLGLSKYTQLR